jgi:hypothetical protein
VGRQAVGALYVLVMAGVVVGVDILFFKHQFGPRLIANVGIVLVFGVIFLVFVRRRVPPT